MSERRIGGGDHDQRARDRRTAAEVSAAKVGQDARRIRDLEAQLAAERNAYDMLIREANQRAKEAREFREEILPKLVQAERERDEAEAFAERLQESLRGRELAPWLKSPAFRVRKHPYLSGYQVAANYHEGSIVAYFEEESSANESCDFLCNLWAAKEADLAELRALVEQASSWPGEQLTLLALRDWLAAHPPTPAQKNG